MAALPVRTGHQHYVPLWLMKVALGAARNDQHRAAVVRFSATSSPVPSY